MVADLTAVRDVRYEFMDALVDRFDGLLGFVTFFCLQSAIYDSEDIGQISTQARVLLTGKKASWP